MADERRTLVTGIAGVLSRAENRRRDREQADILSLDRNTDAALAGTRTKVKFTGTEIFGWVHGVPRDHGFPRDPPKQSLGRSVALRAFFPFLHM